MSPAAASQSQGLIPGGPVERPRHSSVGAGCSPRRVLRLALRKAGVRRRRVAAGLVFALAASVLAAAPASSTEVPAEGLSDVGRAGDHAEQGPGTEPVADGAGVLDNGENPATAPPGPSSPANNSGIGDGGDGVLLAARQLSPNTIAPPGFSASVRGESEVRLTWTTIPEPLRFRMTLTGYLLQYKKSGTDTWTDYSGTLDADATSATLTNLDSVLYNVRIAGRDDNQSYTGPYASLNVFPVLRFGPGSLPNSAHLSGIAGYDDRLWVVTGGRDRRVRLFELDGTRDNAREWSMSNGYSWDICIDGRAAWITDTGLGGGIGRLFRYPVNGSTFGPQAPDPISANRPHGLWCDGEEMMTVEGPARSQRIDVYERSGDTSYARNIARRIDLPRNTELDASGVCALADRTAIWVSRANSGYTAGGDVIAMSPHGAGRLERFDISDTTLRTATVRLPYGIWCDGSHIWITDANSTITKLPLPNLDTGPPLPSGATLSGTTLVVRFNRDLDTSVTPATDRFRITEGDLAAVEPTAVAHATGDTKALELTLPSKPEGENAVVVAYTDPAGDDTAGVVQLADGTDAPAFPSLYADNTNLSAPQSLSFENSSATLDMSWAPPAHNPDSATGYVLQYRQQGTDPWTDYSGALGASAVSATLTSRTDYAVYELRVAARSGPNDADIGPFSDIVAAIPAPVTDLSDELSATATVTGVWGADGRLWVVADGDPTVRAIDLATGNLSSSHDWTLPSYVTHAQGICTDGRAAWISDIRPPDEGDDDGSRHRLYRFPQTASGFDTSAPGELAVEHPFGLWCDGDNLLAGQGQAAGQQIAAYRRAGDTSYQPDSSRDVAAPEGADHTYHGVWAPDSEIAVWMSRASQSEPGSVIAVSPNGAGHLDQLDIDATTLTAAGIRTPRGIWSDGSHMWIADADNNRVVKLQLPALDQGPPVPTGATVADAQLTLRFNRALDTSVTPATARFRITVGDAAAVAPTAVAHATGNDTALDLTLASAPRGDHAVTVAYTDPSGDDTTGVVQAADGTDAGAFASLRAANTNTGPPREPESLSFKVGSASLELSWEPPAGIDAGTPITGYAVRYRKKSAARWTTLTRTDSTALTETITSLDTYTDYFVEVAAQNSVDHGPYARVEAMTADAIDLSDTITGSLSARGLWSDGVTIWVVEDNARVARAFTLATRARDTTKDLDFGTLTGSTSSPRGICSDGTTTWIAGLSGVQDHTLYAFELTGTNWTYDSSKNIDPGNGTYPQGLSCDTDSLRTVAALADDGQQSRTYSLPGRDRHELADFGLPDTGLEPSDYRYRGLWSDGVVAWASRARVDGTRAEVVAFTVHGGYRQLPIYETRRGLGRRDNGNGPLEFTAARLARVGISSPQGIWSDGSHMWIADLGGQVVKLPLRQYSGAALVPASYEIVDADSFTVTFSRTIDTLVQWLRPGPSSNPYAVWVTPEGGTRTQQSVSVFWAVMLWAADQPEMWSLEFNLRTRLSGGELVEVTYDRGCECTSVPFYMLQDRGNHYAESFSLHFVYVAAEIAAPVVTVQRVINSFRADDDDTGTTTWHYVWIAGSAACDGTTNFNRPTSYTEYAWVDFTVSNQGRKVCFRSVNASNNTGYGASSTVDLVAPTVTVSAGTNPGTFKAIDDDTGTTTWKYRWVTGTQCDRFIQFVDSNSTVYTEGTDIDPRSSNHGRRLCFRSTDNNGNTGYGRSEFADRQAPAVTAAAGGTAGSFKATDNDGGTTTWHYVWIDGGATCDASTNFDSATGYDEGDDVAPAPANHGQRLCFRSTDTAGNNGYDRSDRADLQAPTVTVSAGVGAGTLKAEDDNPATTTWHYVRIDAGGACGASTDFASATSYNEGSDVTLTMADDGRRLCFRSVDAADNAGYGVSMVINVAAPAVTVSAVAGVDAFEATDDDTGTTTWHYVWIGGTATCGATTNFASATSYTEGDDVAYTTANENRKLCFRSVNASNNTGYGASDPADLTAPAVTVSAVAGVNAFEATDNDAVATTWHYVWTAADADCDVDTDFASAVEYTEGDDVAPGTANHGRRLCFRSADTYGNTGYGYSDAADAQAPTVTVAAGNDPGTFKATDNDDSGTTTWHYVWTAAGADCDADTNFSSPTNYTEGDDVDPGPTHHGRRLCFRSADTNGNTGYGHSDAADRQAPTVTVARGTAAGSFKATDNDDSGTTTWHYEWTAASANCDADTNFNSATAYTEGDTVDPGSAVHGRRLCFRSTDTTGNAGYGRSDAADRRAPTVTVAAVAGVNAFEATDDDAVATTWHYVWTAADTDCDADTDFSGSNSYGEGDDVRPAPANDGRRLCFRSTDAKGNSGYARSGVADGQTPTVTVAAGNDPGTFKATDDDAGTTTWHYVWTAGNADCDADTSFNSPTNYTEGADVNPRSGNHGRRLCFRSTDPANNRGYGRSDRADRQAPTVTVAAGNSAGTFKATDNDAGTTTWQYVWIAGNANCSSSTSFNSATDYTEGDDVGSGDHGRRLCFRSTDTNGNTGYDRSDTADRQAPTVTVVAGTGPGTFEATDNDSGATTWQYVWTAADADCDADTTFNSARNYSEGDDVDPDSGDHGRRLCFRSTDTNGNTGYGRSGIADAQAPTVTVAAGNDAGSFKATDDDSGTTTWQYVWTAAGADCDADTSFNSARNYSEGVDVDPGSGDHDRRLCFRSVDGVGNTGYGRSGIADAQAPTVTVAAGNEAGSFKAIDDDSGTTTWRYVWTAGNGPCDANTNFNGSSSYTEGDDVDPQPNHHRRRLCFRSVDGVGNTGYGRSGIADAQAPTVTVSVVSGANAFEAVDNDSGTTTWHYVWTAADADCDTGTNFNSAATYSEGVDVVPGSGDHGRRLCFRSVDGVRNSGYGRSGIADAQAPTVTVAAGNDPGTFKATDDDTVATTWRYVWTAADADCDTGTNFNSAVTYSENTDVNPGSGHDGRRLCFRSVDGVGNTGYGHSGVADRRRPTVTVAAGGATGTRKATDDDSATTTWHYVSTTAGAACGSSTGFGSATTYTEGADVVLTTANEGRRLCFRSADTSGNVGYGRSMVIDLSAPAVTVAAGVGADTLKATDDDTGTTTWQYVWTAAGAACGSSTGFGSATTYTEGADVVLTTANEGRRLCFRSVNTSNNAGYGASGTVDLTAPAVTVSAGTDPGTFKATDNDTGTTTWQYVWTDAGADCDTGTNFNSATSYTENTDINPGSGNHGRRLCFRSTDTADNRGHGHSDAADRQAPTVTVAEGTDPGTFKATDNDTGTTAWHYVWTDAGADCDTGTNFSSPRNYTEDDDVNPGSGDHGRRLCFRSTDTAGNAGHGHSDAADRQAPTVTVAEGTDPGTFKATDDDSGTTTWQYVSTSAGANCTAGTNFDSATSYTEDDTVDPGPGDHGRRLCFRSTDTAGNAGHGRSDAADRQAPTVTVSAGNDPGTFKATDNDSATTTWQYVWTAGGGTCNDSTSFNSATDYTEGDDVNPGPGDHGRRLCFRSTDTADNAGHGHSDAADRQAPTVTVAAGNTAGSFKATDNDTDTTTWQYVWTAGNATCDDSTSFSGSSSYTEDRDVNPAPANDGRRLCFQSTDTAGNAGHGRSDRADRQAPTVTLAAGNDPGTFRATDDDDNTTWQYVWTGGGSNCGSSTSFSGSTSYTEGDDVDPQSSHDGRRLCFRSTDTNGNAGYGRSEPADRRPPTVTVAAGTGSGTFKATDNDADAAWQYVWGDASANCDDSTSFSGSTSYTEGDDVDPQSSHDGRRLCFQSTDTNGNAGYGRSERADRQAPTVTVEAGTVPRTRKATDNDSGTTTWKYEWTTAGGNCDPSTDFNSAGDYTEGANMVLQSADEGLRLCFRSTDTDGNPGYGQSTVIDLSAPAVTVTRVPGTDAFEAVDDDPTDTTWHHVWIAGNATCDASTDFNSATDYTEGDDVPYTTAHEGRRLCFRSVNASDNAGHRASIPVDLTAPAVTVTALTGVNAFEALDDDPVDTAWHYTWTAAGAACDDTTSFAGSSRYTEGEDVTYTSTRIGRQACFRSTDIHDNSGYAASSEVDSVLAVPGAPTDVTAQSGDRSAEVAWTAPGDNGGSRITGYAATASPSGNNCITSGATFCTITGLSSGTSYTFTVTATNSQGTSSRSEASDPVVPTGSRDPGNADPPGGGGPPPGGGGGPPPGGGGGGGGGDAPEQAAQPTGAAGAFTDIEADDYFAPAVTWMLEHNITTGCGQEMFCPSRAVTRQEFVTFLWRAAGRPVPEALGSEVFTDVESSYYSDSAIGWAVQAGVTVGCRDQDSTRWFCPSRPATRAQIATLLYRYIHDDQAQQPPAQTGFNDVDPNAYYAPAVAWMVEHNITTGCEPDTFCSGRSATRAHTAAFLFRIHNNPQSWIDQGILRTPAQS